jgi:hypothetical protein
MIKRILLKLFGKKKVHKVEKVSRVGISVKV